MIKKYQYISDNIIIGTGHGSGILEYYVIGKYPSLDIKFSRENVDELNGPGQSLVYALDCASSRLPTIITFCDYIIKDNFSVDIDTLCVSVPSSDSVLGTYHTTIDSEDGIAIKLKHSDDLHLKKHGFIGLSVIHNTLLLKSIAYNLAYDGNVVYEDIVQGYIDKIRTSVTILKNVLEFGVEKSLKETRGVLDRDN